MPELTLLDGPLGTELAARGVQTPLPLWSAAALREAPEKVSEVHRAYVDAGATVHTTNTFRTQRRTAGRGWRELTVQAVMLARGATPFGQKVAGSVAPLEDCYRPELSPEDPEPEHRLMVETLAAAGCDLLLCETFPQVDEALIAVKAAVATGVETWLALTAGPGADLLSPEALARGAAEAVGLGARAVLVNCVPTADTRRYVDAIAQAVGGTAAVGAYANAGRADDAMGWRADPLPAAEAANRYAEVARGWVDAGATIFGGCCGTGPAHVRALRDAFLR